MSIIWVDDSVHSSSDSRPDSLIDGQKVRRLEGEDLNLSGSTHTAIAELQRTYLVNDLRATSLIAVQLTF
jgi:hypothetical protein